MNNSEIEHGIEIGEINVHSTIVSRFETVDESILDLKMEDYKIVDDFHSSFLIEDHLNTSVEI